MQASRSGVLFLGVSVATRRTGPPPCGELLCKDFPGLQVTPTADVESGVFLCGSRDFWLSSCCEVDALLRGPLGVPAWALCSAGLGTLEGRGCACFLESRLVLLMKEFGPN